MKAQCDRCKEIVPLEFSVELEGIHVRCPSCRGEYRVTATAAAAPTGVAGNAPAVAPAPQAEMTCPKCGEGQKKAEACRRCGLVLTHWKADSVSADPVIGDTRSAAALWSTLESHWDEGEQHEAFIAHCRRTGVLAFAAARYRQAQARPGSAARLAQIRVLAEQSLAAAPRAAAAPATRTTARTVLLAAVIIILVALIFLLIQSAVDVPRH